MKYLTEIEQLQVQAIIEVVCKVKKVEKEVLWLKRRFADVMKARYLFAYLAMKHTEMDQKQIGRVLKVSTALIYVGTERHSDDVRFLREIAEETALAERMLNEKFKKIERKVKKQTR